MNRLFVAFCLFLFFVFADDKCIYNVHLETMLHGSEKYVNMKTFVIDCLLIMLRGRAVM